jgi:hypothetical protein
MHRTRDWRRAQRQKAMQHLIAWMKEYPHYHKLGEAIKLHHRVVRMTDNPQSCSCWVCGNPRKWFKDQTIQEIKSEITCHEIQKEEGVRVH